MELKNLITQADLDAIAADVEASFADEYRRRVNKLMDDRLNGVLRPIVQGTAKRYVPTQPLEVSRNGTLSRAESAKRDNDTVTYITNARRCLHVSEISAATGYTKDELTAVLKKLVNTGKLGRIKVNNENIKTYYGIPEYFENGQVKTEFMYNEYKKA